MAVLTPGTAEPSGTGPERRKSRRRPLTEIPDITGVTVQSQKVQVIDAASGGLLIQSPLRLSPGTRARVEIARSESPLSVGGRVLRSEVVGLSNKGIEYRSAIALDCGLDFIDQDPSGAITMAGPAGNLGDFVARFDAEGVEPEPLTRNDW